MEYLIAPYALWIFYLAIMSLSRAKQEGTISRIALLLGYPILLIGVVLDFIVNLIIMSLLFLEPPKELLVTKRLTRHVQKGKGWRQKLAYWICHHLLNAFDPSGDHCS